MLLLDDCQSQLPLGREVEVECSLGDSGTLGDVAQACVAVPNFCEDMGGTFNDGKAGVFRTLLHVWWGNLSVVPKVGWQQQPPSRLHNATTADKSKCEETD